MGRLHLLLLDALHCNEHVQLLVNGEQDFRDSPCADSLAKEVLRLDCFTSTEVWLQRWANLVVPLLVDEVDPMLVLNDMMHTYNNYDRLFFIPLIN